MKIIQINSVYLKGSTGKIVKDLHEELKNQGYETVVCYGRGKKVKEKNVFKICSEFYAKCNVLLSMITGLAYGGCFFSTSRLIAIIKKEKPDIVHLHCINGNFVNIYRLLNWLKKNNVKTVLTLHAEFMYTANCGHAFECDKWKNGCGKCEKLKESTKSLFIDNTSKSWKKMYNAFDGYTNLIVTSVSPWLKSRAIQSPILKEKKHIVIYNGINTDVFKKTNTNKLKERMSLNGKKVVFHVTAHFSNKFNDAKGGYYILKLAKMLENQNIQVLIAVKYDKEIEIPNNVTLLGEVLDQNLLAQYYNIANVTVLASKRETFSMPVAESLCCGTPVVGFKSGAPEQITIDEYSSFVEYGNIQELYNATINMINIGKSDKMIDIARNKYSKETMTKKYVELYNNTFLSK